MLNGSSLCGQADVYSFAMICYELFEGRKPFDNMDAMSAARSASLFDRRPSWGKHNRRVSLPRPSDSCNTFETQEHVNTVLRV